MKTLISIISGLLVFIGVFIIDWKFAGWVVSPLHGDVKVVIKIAFLLFTGGVVLWFATICGGIAGVITDSFLKKK